MRRFFIRLPSPRFDKYLYIPGRLQVNAVVPFSILTYRRCKRLMYL